MDEKKRKLYRILPVVLSAILMLIIGFTAVKVLTSSYSVIIKDQEMHYFLGEKLFICGNTVICRRDPESVIEKSLLPREIGSGAYFTVLSMSSIISIETFHEEESAEGEAIPVNPLHIGRFKIQLQGHEGILLLGVSKDRAYGTVRFPQWGKGAEEYLKSVKIDGGRVSFVRSASSKEEIKRLGANYLFKQKFSGTYSPSGKVIKGYMINDRGEKNEWEAEKK